jgi:hypothetical protein
MLKVFNTNSLGQNERFKKALLFGIPSSILLAIFLAIIQRLLSIRFSLLYILIGFLIAYILKKYGKGVQIRFSYLGAILTLISILLGDALTLTGTLVFQNPTILIQGLTITLRSWVSPNINNLLAMLFRIYAIYYAYNNSRII